MVQLSCGGGLKDIKKAEREVQYKIEGCAKVKKELKAQFLSGDVSWMARHADLSRPVQSAMIFRHSRQR